MDFKWQIGLMLSKQNLSWAFVSGQIIFFKARKLHKILNFSLVPKKKLTLVNACNNCLETF